MIDPAYVQLFAAYNAWQNDNLLNAASGLDDAMRRADRGAFFGSIHASLNHLLWGDRMWMSRLAAIAPPQTVFPGLAEVDDWAELTLARKTLDAQIVDWADRLAPQDLAGELVWISGMLKTEVRRPRWIAVVHMFNHQTHHRGQVHGLLTGLGAAPSETDLVMSPAAKAARVENFVELEK